MNGNLSSKKSKNEREKVSKTWNSINRWNLVLAGLI